MTKIDVIVRSEDSRAHFRQIELPLLLGRQRPEDIGWLDVQDLGSFRRINVAPLECVNVSRKAIRVEDSKDGYRVVNIHERNSFGVNSELLVPKAARECHGSTVLNFADDICVTLVANDSNHGWNIADQSFRTLGGGDQDVEQFMPTGTIVELLDPQARGNAPGQVAVDLVRQALEVVQKAAGSDEYYDAAVRAAVNMIQLDRAYIMVLSEQNQWSVRAKYFYGSDTSELLLGGNGEEKLPQGSSKIRDLVVHMKDTVIYDPQTSSDPTGSVLTLDRAVAAPMLNESGKVMGVLYGDRKRHSERGDQPIGDLEATLLKVMAAAVASGIARKEEEEKRLVMAQFFSPAVAARLNQHRNLLDGRDADITVLFCDIRGFSAIAERVEPTRTIEWINDVLTELSQCVIDTDGVLVDYVGDELFAMWGAPAEQPDHADRACQAATAMLGKIELLRERWQTITPDRFGFGIGINTGPARVGNTGSQLKFKYGPLGNTVNIGSRVQGMSKKFGVSAIATAATRNAIQNRQLQFRRLADVRPAGVVDVVTVFELNGFNEPAWSTIRDRYEQALNFLQTADLTNAARELAMLVHEFPNDAPSVHLLGRVVNALTNYDKEFDPVLFLDSK